MVVQHVAPVVVGHNRLSVGTAVAAADHAPDTFSEIHPIAIHESHARRFKATDKDGVLGPRRRQSSGVIATAQSR